MLDKHGIDALVEELSQLAEQADNALCATGLRVSPEIHMQGLKGSLLSVRNSLAKIVGQFEPDTEWTFGYEEEPEVRL